MATDTDRIRHCKRFSALSSAERKTYAMLVATRASSKPLTYAEHEDLCRKAIDDGPQSIKHYSVKVYFGDGQVKGHARVRIDAVDHEDAFKKVSKAIRKLFKTSKIKISDNYEVTQVRKRK